MNASSDSTDAPPIALRAAVAIAAGAVLSLVAPPINLHWIHWLAYTPMLWVLRKETPRQNRWLALVFGMAAVGAIFRWIAETIILFSNIPGPVAYLILGLFALAFGLQYIPLWAAVHPARKRLGIWWILAIPALQVLLEYGTMRVFLFPYNHGVSQYRVAYTWQLASVTGIWGLTYLVFLVNCAVGEWIYRAREGRRAPVRALCGAAIALDLTLIYGVVRSQQVEATLAAAPTARVAQIQTSLTMGERLLQSGRKTFRAWADLTGRIEPGSADLVIWPEGASPYNVHEGPAHEYFKGVTQLGGFEVLVGGGTRVYEEDAEGERQLKTAHNSVYLFGRDGSIRGRYDKLVPLPFGEYLPLANTFPILREWIRGPGNFLAGTEALNLDSEVVGPIAAPICYEAILPQVCSRYPRPGVLVNVTNDGWFGDTAAPHQHAMLAAVRAVELGVPVIRSGYTGISMVIEPHGRIHSETEPFTEVARVTSVRLATFPTLYSRFGDWFVALCALGLAGGWLATRRPNAEATDADEGLPAEASS